MAALLDLLDCNVQLWNGDHHLQSPGYALLDGGEYRFGQAARSAARLRPRDINTRYWWQLSMEPLQPALGPARHTGDLVHAHLQSLYREGGEPGEAILAVPGSMQREQLSLLLGIVQQCPFDAVGLVNRSVALGSLFGGTGALFHVEIQLHQGVLIELAAGDDLVEHRRTLPLPGCGMLQLQERLVEIIAAAFVRQTRFDPRRKAATEQQLYDALPDALRDLASAPETNIEVNGYRARIGAAELESAGQRLFDALEGALDTRDRTAALVADPLAGLMPGLGARFPQLEVVRGQALHDALCQHGDRLVEGGQALSFITSLPVLAPAADSPAATDALAPALTPKPTHLLRQAHAQPLVATGTPLADGWSLQREGTHWKLSGRGDTPLVNGADYLVERPLVCGDRIRIGSAPEVMLIEVSD